MATLRRLATEQLDLITRTLEEGAGMHGAPRDQLQERINQLRWWLARLEKHAARDQHGSS